MENVYYVSYVTVRDYNKYKSLNVSHGEYVFANTEAEAAGQIKHKVGTNLFVIKECKFSSTKSYWDVMQGWN